MLSRHLSILILSRAAKDGKDLRSVDTRRLCCSNEQKAAQAQGRRGWQGRSGCDDDKDGCEMQTATRLRIHLSGRFCLACSLEMAAAATCGGMHISQPVCQQLICICQLSIKPCCFVTSGE